MSAPRIDQINLVLTDVAAAANFLDGLGVSMNPVLAEWSDWAEHHQNVAAPELAGFDPFGIELDSSAFARHWGGLPADFVGVVLNLRVDQREDVDRLFAEAVAAGAEARRPPHDAFWGSRFAVVQAPGPMVLGLLSPRDPSHQGAPPAISDFT
jgi:hypothetical protein